MTKISKSDLKKKLKECTPDELANELCKLSTIFPQVNAYFFVKYGGEAAAIELLDNAKEIISNEFFPQRGMPRARISAAKKAISDFKKQCADQTRIAELQLYYVNTVSEFADTFGADEALCDTIYSVFQNFADTVAKYLDENTLKQFIPVIRNIEEISYRIGYGMDGFVSYILCDNGIMIDEED